MDDEVAEACAGAGGRFEGESAEESFADGRVLEVVPLLFAAEELGMDGVPGRADSADGGLVAFQELQRL